MATIATLLVKMGVLDETDEGTRSVSSGLKDFGGKMAGLAAGIGAAAGAVLAAAFAEAMDLEKANDRLAAQLGASKEMAAELGKTAGSIYAQNFGESIGDVNDAIKAVFRSGLLPEDAAQADIEAMTKKLMTLADVMGEDVTMAARAAGTMIKTGLAKDAAEAFDILLRGEQQGVNIAEDLLDTFSEYSTKFRDLGLSGTQAMGLLSQGLKAGARDADTVADALKEFAILAMESGGTASEAFKALGMNAEKTAQDIAAGGPRAAAALDMTLDRLRAMTDPVKRNALAVQLFGTKAEDLGDALFALDPSSAVAAMGKVAGAVDDAANTIGDNAAGSLESLKRTFMVGFAEAIAPAVPAVNDAVKELLPAITDMMKELSGPETIKVVKDLSGVLVDLVPVIVFFAHGSMLVTGALITLVGWIITAVKWLFSAKGAGEQISNAWSAVTGFFTSAGQKIGAFFAAIGRFFTDTVPGWGSALVAWLSALPGRALAALQALPGVLVGLAKDGLNRMAYNVGYGIGLVIRFFMEAPGKIWALITGLWDRSIELTSAGIAAVVGWVQALPGRVATYVMQTKDRAVATFTELRTAAANKAGELVSAVLGWLQSLPGRARAAVSALPGQVMGALQSAVSGAWNIGQNIVEGMINGIRSMAGRLFSMAKDVARSALDGAKKALGIASPSKVAALQVGMPVGEGIAVGLHRSIGIVTAAGERVGAAAVPHLARPGVVNPGVFGPAAAGDGTGGGQTVVQVLIGGKVVEDVTLRVIQGNPRAVALANNAGQRDLAYT